MTRIFSFMRLIVLFVVVVFVSACGDQQGSLADVCSLVDLQDGPIVIEGIDGARQYYAEIRDAAKIVDDPDLGAIADSYGRVFDVLDQWDGEDRQELYNDPAFIEAGMSLKVVELVGICIDHGLIDERFRDGLPG